IVPVFRVTVPTNVTATVVLTFGRQQPAAGFGPEPGVVVDRAGWYRGDLHCHTPESSDAWKSGSALTPAEWASHARRHGLDYLAMTDHNVVTQNLHLARDAGADVLLIAGEEMTNWFHGHATVSGIAPGDWLDWRQSPAGLPLPTGHARIADFLAVTREMQAYVAAAHPASGSLAWQFVADGAHDPAARPDGWEVWTGVFQPDNLAALAEWDRLLQQGWRIWANGGSDLHGTVNTNGVVFGTPTTVVYAAKLSKAAIVAALRKGRTFITRRPDGVEIYLSATGPGGQAQIVGGTIHGRPSDQVSFHALVRRAAGMRLHLIVDGALHSVTPITEQEQEVRVTLPIAAGGYLRAEVHGQPFLDPVSPAAGRLDMEAITNPIFLVEGALPSDLEPVVAPPGAPGPRRSAG
ncbi:MAG: CehA/McbA family metallohydrolase, partial [Mycobacteriales bacterium]